MTFNDPGTLVSRLMTLFMTALRPAFWMSLKKRTQRASPDEELQRYFQWLTKNIGYPKLREHPGAVIATMKMSSDWYDFKTKLDKHYPRIGKPAQLSMEF